MKYIIFIIIIGIGVLNADIVKVDIMGDSYEINVSTDPQQVITDYIEAITLYMEESIDHESTLALFEKYKKDSETLIASQKGTIELLENEIKNKDKHITYFEDLKKPLFRLSPFGTLVFKEGLEGFGLGLGLSISDLYLQVAIQYPIQISLSTGWRF